jgi:hypothetical protein
MSELQTVAQTADKWGIKILYADDHIIHPHGLNQSRPLDFRFHYSKITRATPTVLGVLQDQKTWLQRNGGVTGLTGQ